MQNNNAVQNCSENEMLLILFSGHDCVTMPDEAQANVLSLEVKDEGECSNIVTILCVRRAQQQVDIPVRGFSLSTIVRDGPSCPRNGVD